MEITWTHPVEQVSWVASDGLLTRAGLTLPTEAQWERGARAGTDTPWWTGSELSSLAGTGDFLDLQAVAFAPQWGRQIGDFDDGFVSPSPVGHYRANAFGLFDTHGNVWEWCRDVFAAPYGAPRAGDGLREPAGRAEARVCRGGSFNVPTSAARSAYRLRYAPEVVNSYIGLRPARTCD